MKIPYFCCIGAELKRYEKDFDFMNQVYLYKIPADDTIEEVLAQDYFQQIADTVLQDDILYIYEPTAQVLHTCRFNKQGGHITAVQLANNIPGLTPNRVLISDATGHITAGDVTLEYLKNKVNLNGSSIMTGPLKFKAGSFSGAIAGGLGDGVSIYKIKADGTIDSEVASLTKTNGFTPGTTNAQNIGSTTLKWKDAHIARVITAIINNGYDIAVPVTNSADSFALESEITAINGKIPAQASTSNQLADKSFVNSSIATNTANFIGTFNSVADLEAYSGTVTNNDYAFVVGTDSAGNTTYNRYKYTTSTTPASWVYEYTLNNSSFTSDQWAAINSGVTTSDVSKARSAVQPGDVGNGTITITQGGTTKGTFTTNQGGNTTIDLDAGTLDPHRIIEFQAPTAANNYTWYRKYVDGWVEQGGAVENNSSASNTINLPVTMSDTHYTVVLGGKYDNNSAIAMFNSKTINSFVVTCQNYNHTDTARDFDWQVSGMAAS